jgi:hypothetical protein
MINIGLVLLSPVVYGGVQDANNFECDCPGTRGILRAVNFRLSTAKHEGGLEN